MKLFKDLLFLHGHIADPGLALSLAARDEEPPADAVAHTPDTDPASADAAPCRVQRGPGWSAVCSLSLSSFR